MLRKGEELYPNIISTKEPSLEKKKKKKMTLNVEKTNIAKNLERIQ